MSKELYYFTLIAEPDEVVSQDEQPDEMDVWFGNRDDEDNAQYIATFADHIDALDYCEWRNEEVENDLDDLVDAFEEYPYDDVPELDEEWNS